jgi:hypothetical protein
VKQLDWTPETLENPNGDLLLEGIARFHGLDDNIVHMLADCIEFAPKLKRVQKLLVAVYGPDWLPALEAAAAARLEQGGAFPLKQSSAKHESSRRRKG